MTVPRERTIAVDQARRLLLDLCSTAITPRVPAVVRRRARAILKHYPDEWHIEQLCARAPEIMSRKF